MAEDQRQDIYDMDSKVANAADVSSETVAPTEVSEQAMKNAIDAFNALSQRRAETIKTDSVQGAAEILQKASESMTKSDSKLLEAAVAGLLDIAAAINGAIGGIASEKVKANDARIQKWKDGLSNLLARKQMLKEGKTYAGREHHVEGFRVKTDKGLTGNVKDFGESMRLMAHRAIIDKDVATLRFTGEKWNSTAELFTGFSVGLKAMSEKIRPAQSQKPTENVA